MKMKKQIHKTDIKRLQELAGINEWKVKSEFPLFKKGDKGVDQTTSRGLILTVVGYPVKGFYEARNQSEDFDLPNVLYGTFGRTGYTQEKEKSKKENIGYFYPVTNGTNTFWISEVYLLYCLGDKRFEQLDSLNEWKLEPYVTAISPEELDDFGYYDNYLDEFVVEPDPDKHAAWLDKYFPGWENDKEKEKTGAKMFSSAIENAVKLKYGDKTVVMYLRF